MGSKEIREIGGGKEAMHDKKRKKESTCFKCLSLSSLRFNILCGLAASAVWV